MKKGKEMAKKYILLSIFIAFLVSGCGQSSLDSVRIQHHIDFDWKFSEGARIEEMLARYAGLRIIEEDDLY